MSFRDAVSSDASTTRSSSSLFFSSLVGVFVIGATTLPPLAVDSPLTAGYDLLESAVVLCDGVREYVDPGYDARDGVGVR